jgi:hypothetical protein
MNKKVIFGLLILAGTTMSCEKATQQAKEEATQAITKTKADVQKVIDEQRGNGR